MTDTKAALDKKFDRWFYTARDPVKDLPYGSHLIYRVCDNDKDRFEIGCELLKAAFVGGHESALTTPPAPTVMGGDVREAVDVLLEAYSRYYSDEANFERKVKEATETIMRNLRAATQPPSTPAALWRQDGSADPHAGKYDCERAQLLMGEMTDDEIANELFMQLPVGMAGIGQAVKDRIRWLSRKLVEATQPPQATDAQAQSDTGLRYCPKCDYGYTEGENCRCQQPKAAAKDKLETEPKVLQIYGAYYIGPKHGFSSEKEARDWIKSLKGSKQ